MNKKKYLSWALFLLVLFISIQFFSKKNESAPANVAEGILITPTKTEYASGEDVAVKIRNNMKEEIIIPSNCPKNPLKISSLSGDKYQEISKESPIDCKSVQNITIPAGAEQVVAFKYWNYALFSEPGQYKIELPTITNKDNKPILTSTPAAEFSVVQAGFFRKLFRMGFYQPIYNALVFFISISPFSDLGFAIILLTLAIRLILLIPSQKAIVSQRRMQELQPKLEEIKKKFEGNQERIAKETMALWKQHKVSPFGSCLPLIIQFPVLIALYYVIQNGLNPDNAFMIYSPLKGVDLLHLHTNFLNILDLTAIDRFVLPLIVGALQFLQMKLAASKQKKNGAPTAKSEMETANKTMMYIMPVMIAMFTASVPAGVGLYWGVSTLFGIGQQMIVNRKIQI